jgi:hypothetical protein
MLSANNSTLVAGASQSSRGQVMVRVLRAFSYGGIVVSAGTERTFDAVFVAEMVSAGKVQRIAAPTPKPAPNEPAKKE